MPGIEDAVEKLKSSRRNAEQVRVGIIGYGTVGRATAEILSSHAEEISQKTGGVSIVVTRISRKRPRTPETGVNGITVVSDWRQVATADDVDIVVEAIGGTSVARDVVRTSLEHGKAVVTANKALIALHGDELFALAQGTRRGRSHRGGSADRTPRAVRADTSSRKHRPAAAMARRAPWRAIARSSLQRPCRLTGWGQGAPFRSRILASNSSLLISPRA